MTLDELFEGFAESRRLFETVRGEVEALSGVGIWVSGPDRQVGGWLREAWQAAGER